MEIILGSITFFILIIASFSVYFAVKGMHQFYWISAITIYIFSFLTSFTIGLITVGLTFVALVLAIGYALGWIKGKVSLILFLLLSIIIGFLMVYYVRDYLFYPLEFILN